jgi:cellulose synthase/poly-beta-1,6-N-acetylglucosamine synthase-like glycosyltransferase
MIVVALVIFEALRLAFRAMLLVLTFHFVQAAWRASRGSGGDQVQPPESWPAVTVQLPLRNEYYVAERVIRAAAALDYPPEALEIQVLDDSDDATLDRVRQIVAVLRAEGHRIEHIVRGTPSGFKAGALNHGLLSARGEFLAMFDADCVPPRDFLRRVMPHFADPKVGCVQVRWTFLNRAHSLLTRVQAIVLDGLFYVDQYARASSGLPLQFNGTNGVWRRSAIEAAGGWNAKILAEDADLSFRAFLAGYRVLHVRDFGAPTEIPADMAAFRAQQRRWALGSAQMLRALSIQILRAPIPVQAKLLMFMHLGRHSIDPLILLACLTSPFTTLYDQPFLIDYGVGLNVGLVGVVGLGCVLFYGTAIRKRRARVTEILLVPLVIVLAIGLSLAYSIAFVKGIFRLGGRFERTPKDGGAADGGSGPHYRALRDPLAVLEVLLAGAHAYFCVGALQAGYYAYAGFFAIVALSFGWVGLGTLLSRGVGRRAKAPSPR